jgi:hypothetical protein
VIHTLLALSRQPESAADANLYARVAAPSVAGLESLPAKLILLDTLYSTMSEPLAIRPGRYEATFQLRHLPPGTYYPVVYRVGCLPLFAKPVVLKAGASVEAEWNLEASMPAGNLVRNADFKIRWSSKDRPEHWQYNGSKAWWVSDNIRIEAGRKYRAVVAPANSQTALVWLRREWPQELGEPVNLSAAETPLTAPPQAAYARIIIRGRATLSANLKNIALIAE